MSTHCHGYYCDGSVSELDASRSGDIETLESTFNESRRSDEHYQHCADEAVRGDQLKVLQWMHAKGIDIGDNWFEPAIEGGHCEIVEWAAGIINIEDWDAWETAIYYEQTDVLECLQRIDYPIDEAPTLTAAFNGSRKCLEWLISAGYEIDPAACKSKLQRGCEQAVANRWPGAKVFKKFADCAEYIDSLATRIASTLQ